MNHYNLDLAVAIAESVAGGLSLKAACAEHGVPYKRAQRWVREDIDGFRTRYLTARVEQAYALVDEIVEIADGCPLNAAAVQRAALQIRTRQWLVEKTHAALFTGLPKTVVVENPDAVCRPADFLKAWRDKHAAAANEVN